MANLLSNDDSHWALSLKIFELILNLIFLSSSFEIQPYG